MYMCVYVCVATLCINLTENLHSLLYMCVCVCMYVMCVCVRGYLVYKSNERIYTVYCICMCCVYVCVCVCL